MQITASRQTDHDHGSTVRRPDSQRRSPASVIARIDWNNTHGIS